MTAWNPHHVLDWLLALAPIVVWLIYLMYFQRTRRMATKPPSTPQELEDDRLATDGYVVPPPGAPAQPSGGRWPTPSGVPVGYAPEPVEPGTVNGVPPLRSPVPPVRKTAAEPEFVIAGTRTAERITCAACGSGWWHTAHQIHTGIRKAERAPGEPPIYICANCGAIYQEVSPNEFERIRFDDGRLTR